MHLSLVSNVIPPVGFEQAVCFGKCFFVLDVFSETTLTVYPGFGPAQETHRLHIGWYDKSSSNYFISYHKVSLVYNSGIFRKV